MFFVISPWSTPRLALAEETSARFLGHLLALTYDSVIAISLENNYIFSSNNQCLLEEVERFKI
jgi:hypothetical protein